MRRVILQQKKFNDILYVVVKVAGTFFIFYDVIRIFYGIFEIFDIIIIEINVYRALNYEFLNV